MRRIKNLILGGGFTGLFLATNLHDAIIVDQSKEPGGLIRGFKTAAGFTYDVGGHVYTTQDETVNRILSHTTASAFRERKAFYDFERMVPFPIQYNADRLGLTPTIYNRKDVYENLADLLVSEFGPELYSLHLHGFNRRVWSTDPSKLDVDWIDGRVALLDEPKEKWGMNSSFAYAPGSEIVNHLMSTVSKRGNEYHGGERIISIDVHAKTVTTTNERYSYEVLFDTTGLSYGEGFFFDKNEVVTIGVGLGKKLDIDFNWWYNSVNNKSPIHRITLLSRYHKSMAPDGVDSLLIEIPKPLTRQSSSMIEFIETRDLCVSGTSMLLKVANFNFVEDRDIEDVAIIKSHGYPIPFVGHRRRTAEARELMLTYGVYLLGRWGAHGYYNLQHIAKDVYETLFVLGGKDPNDYLWANYYYKEKR